MSEPDMYPELDAIADAHSDGERFTIDDSDKASWALRRLATEDAALEEQRALAEREHRRIADWIARVETAHDRRTGFLRAELERYMRDRYVAEGVQTLTFPAGELRARRGPDQWAYDTAAFVAWAEAQGREDLIRRPEPEPDKRAAKKALTAAAHDDGEPGPVPVIDPDTGETIPGIAVTPGETRYTARPHIGGDL